MHPVVGERLAAQRLGLGAFALMMRELQVVASAMDVEGIAQMPLRHRRAFDM
ncbi:hypothetical protein BN871_JR_00010, partial [Paenibacillus sp. P22]